MHREIRAARGRPVAPTGPADEPTGQIGIGRGGAAMPPRPTTPTINDQIRRAAGVVRGKVSIQEVLR
jgi:hypothetical protein